MLALVTTAPGPIPCCVRAREGFRCPPAMRFTVDRRVIRALRGKEIGDHRQQFRFLGPRLQRGRARPCGLVVVREPCGRPLVVRSQRGLKS